MIRVRHILYIGIALLLSSCSDEQEQWPLTVAQNQLIGRAVNFSASHAELFATRTTYNADGSFNEGDVMTIYRQYSEDNGHSFDINTEAYRVYYYVPRKAAGTEIVLGNDWKPMAGAKGSNRPNTTFDQTDADSLTWENGKTVRFRAWSRSNLSNAINNKSKNTYYPDYCVSDWVTVSGPTEAVSLTMKHQGCRIAFTTKAGNELIRAEICTEVDDYMRPDNSTDYAHDESAAEHGKTREQAQAELDQVMAVYNRMCIPARVDVGTSLMKTMTKTLYNSMDDFSKLREKTTADGIVDFNTMSPAEIAASVQHPVFCSNNGRLYMITIPYDMSTADTRGEALTLPACTRFRIWLLDVNGGDKGAYNEESTYHIFSLADVMDKQSGDDKQQLFPDGMELAPGVSYLFSVGYYYDHYTLTPADNFSWEQQDAEQNAGTDETVNITPTGTYQWWKDAIAAAIPTSIQQSYNPAFHINTKAEFLEFIDLVNGTAVNDYVRTNPIVRMYDPTKTYDKDHPATNEDYRWYYASDVENGKVKGGTDSLTHAFAESLGYIFYQHYYPADADRGAYTLEDYLQSPFSFYDDDLRRHFTVWLDADLDLGDQKLTPIGNSTATPFRGVFDGYDAAKRVIHTIKNIYMDPAVGSYMFRYCNEVAIRNLQIETVHDFKLLNQATAINEQTGYGAYIVGIDIKAPSPGNPIATTLTGSSYVVGCTYEGNITLGSGQTNGAMVGTANNLNMYANMMAASGLPAGTGALLGAYAAGSQAFFAPQSGQRLAWGRFMANYYDVTLSPGTNAVGDRTDNYRPQEYIRGRESWILKAKNDNMISGEVPYDNIPTERMKLGYYGLAPWKAMNYALFEYNIVGGLVSESHNCKSHFYNGDTGYTHTYPQRLFGEVNSDADHTGYKGNYESLNLLELLN